MVARLRRFLARFLCDRLPDPGREQKFDVPEQALATALDNLENQLAYDTNVADRGNEMAYALYVLARNRKAAISDLRYYADTMLDQFPTQLAKAHIAAALALYGDHQRSERIFAEVANLSAGLTTVNWARSDYGSNLRDSAAFWRSPPKAARKAPSCRP